jgi:hypothetical protein
MHVCQHIAKPLVVCCAFFRGVKINGMSIITTSPFGELVKMVGVGVAAEMKKDAKDYLLMAKKECGGLLLFVEIAAEREIWKLSNAGDLSEEDYILDQLSFLSAALELDTGNEFSELN